MAENEITVKAEISEQKFTPNDYLKAWQDLKRAIELSCMNDDGSIFSYEINGTARAIPLAVYALVLIREHDKIPTDRLMSL